MEKNFKLVIEYDGTNFFGWQRQKNQRTVQGEIEKQLSVMTQSSIHLIGSGRTDAGVHALGQIANFRCDTRLTPDIFVKGLNSLLPKDIVILSCQEVPLEFHARFDATCKHYQYRILNRPVPSAVECRYSWFIHLPLDLEMMNRAVPYLIGEHDFKAFEGVGSPRVHTVRNVFHAQLSIDLEHHIFFDIKANGFLKYMVRNIVGTLVYVGLGKIPPERVPEIIETKDRRCAGPTAPPHGLFLKHVAYK